MIYKKNIYYNRIYIKRYLNKIVVKSMAYIDYHAISSSLYVYTTSIATQTDRPCDHEMLLAPGKECCVSDM